MIDAVGQYKDYQYNRYIISNAIYMPENVDGSLLDAIVTHPEHGKAKVIKDTESGLVLSLLDSGKEVTDIPKDSVTVLSSAPKIQEDKEDYSEYLTYASDEIKTMFNAFSPEDKKKYTEVVKHTPTQTEFYFDVKQNNGSIQHAIYKVNKQRFNIPDEDLKAGIIEKYEESGYEGSEYFGNNAARTKYTPDGQGLTLARFNALVKAMPAGDYQKKSLTAQAGENVNSALAIRQLFISLGGKWSEHRPVDKNGVVLKKVPANGDPQRPTQGFLALNTVDSQLVHVISAYQDPTNYPKGSIKIVDEKQMYPRVTLAEKPIISYTKDGKPVDKEGKLL